MDNKLKQQIHNGCTFLMGDRYNLPQTQYEHVVYTLYNHGYIKLDNIGQYDELSDRNNSLILSIKRYNDGSTVVIKEINYYYDNPVRSEEEINL